MKKTGFHFHMACQYWSIGILRHHEAANRLNPPQSCPDNRSAGCQRAPRQPDAHRADMPVPDGLLPPGMLADHLYGQINLDESLGQSQRRFVPMLRSSHLIRQDCLPVIFFISSPPG